MSNARPDSWKREPFTRTDPIPYAGRFTKEEFERIKAGLVPAAMEDKWFIYFDESCLFLHKSWTGQGVYRVEFEADADGARAREAHCVADVLAASEPVYQARLLAFLIANLLLGRHELFPMPADMEEAVPGVYQHVIAGTGYPEARVGRRRPWWKFWRK
jgi:hypothetical protein